MRDMRAIYPNGVTRGQFSAIGFQLKSARKLTRLRAYGLYGVFRAILYVLKEGRSWRGFPKRSLVCRYYQIRRVKGRRRRIRSVRACIGGIGAVRPSGAWTGGENECGNHRFQKRQKHRCRRRKKV
jgi:hypothetical protein